jgi:hypothetical protein
LPRHVSPGTDLWARPCQKRIDEDRTAYHPRRGSDSRLRLLESSRLGRGRNLRKLDSNADRQSVEKKCEYSHFTYLHFTSAALGLKGAKNSQIGQSAFANYAEWGKVQTTTLGAINFPPLENIRDSKSLPRTRLSSTRYSPPFFLPCSLRRLCTKFSALLLQHLSRAYPLPCEFAPVSSLLLLIFPFPLLYAPPSFRVFPPMAAAVASPKQPPAKVSP